MALSSSIHLVVFPAVLVLLCGGVGVLSQVSSQAVAPACPFPLLTCGTASGPVTGYCLNPYNGGMYSTVCDPSTDACGSASPYGELPTQVTSTNLWYREQWTSDPTKPPGQCTQWLPLTGVLPCPPPYLTCVSNHSGPILGVCYNTADQGLYSTFCYPTYDQQSPHCPDGTGPNPVGYSTFNIPMWWRTNPSPGVDAYCSAGYIAAPCPAGLPTCIMAIAGEYQGMCLYNDALYSTFCNPVYDASCHGTSSSGPNPPVQVGGVPLWFRTHDKTGCQAFQVMNQIPVDKFLLLGETCGAAGNAETAGLYVNVDQSCSPIPAPPLLFNGTITSFSVIWKQSPTGNGVYQVMVYDVDNNFSPPKPTNLARFQSLQTTSSDVGEVTYPVNLAVEYGQYVGFLFTDGALSAAFSGQTQKYINLAWVQMTGAVTYSYTAVVSV